jgi:Fic family protein
MTNIIWTPKFAITTGIANDLIAIERARLAVEHIHLHPALEEQLRHRARVRSTHYSTRIEGNHLTLAQAQQIVEGKALGFHGRERDVHEVQNYWDALLQVEDWAKQQRNIDLVSIRKLHALVEKGKRAKPTPFRDGQNVIKEASTGRIVYLPPEANDVPGLMEQLVRWIRKTELDKTPVPLVAGLLHYQFVTIHPYYDGNGRTARLLATWYLQKQGYGLNGFFSLEEHHARDLEGYYRSLTVCPDHNYYGGRDSADLSPWLGYFTSLVSRVFAAVQEEAAKAQKSDKTLKWPDELKNLNARARRVLVLFNDNPIIKSQDVAKILSITTRMARLLLSEWAEEGWLECVDKSNRARAYRLPKVYRKFIGSLTEM